MKKILLVEDEAILQRKIARFLEREGFQLLCAGNLEEAFSLLRSALLDLLISDVHLAPGNAFPLMEEARRRSCPVILMTAHRSVEIRKAASQLDIAGFLEKPFHLQALAALVHHVLELAEPTGDGQEEQRGAGSAYPAFGGRL